MEPVWTPAFAAARTVISVTGPLWLWRGNGATWHFVTVPAALADEIRAHALAGPRGFGSVRVEARLHDVTWRTSVFPMKAGGYILPVKAAVRRKAEVAAGDEVTISLELL
jgi:hypothetical protein